MRRLLVALALITGCDEPFAPPVDGVYSLCDEVRGYSGEILELRDGKFRYWFYSDVVTGQGLSYPLTGSYAISGSTLTLGHSGIYCNNRTLAVVNGVPVIWRDDGMAAWNKDHEIHAYGVLIKVEGVLEASPELKRPSIALIKSPDVKQAERKRFEDRYNDRPAEVRTLLRARTLRDDPNLDVYKAEISNARIQPDPRLVAQLIAMFNSEIGRIEASDILNDLYGPSYLIKDPPPFVKDPATRKRALETLIDGLSSVEARDGLEEALLVFLRASDTHKIDLGVPETGLTIRLSVQGRDGYSSDSQGTPVDDIPWKKVIATLIPACQKWMRDQLAR